MVKAAEQPIFIAEFEQQLLQHPKGRTFAIANTSLEELYKNINIGYKKTLTRSEVNKSIKFLQESGLGEMTPAELSTGEGKVKFRDAMTGPAYKSFGQSFTTKFIQGLDKPMASAGLGDSWGRRTIIGELGDAKAKQLFDLQPTRKTIKDFPVDTFPKIKTTLMRLRNTDPEAATQLLFHVLQGFRPEDLNETVKTLDDGSTITYSGLNWENINLRTGEVRLTIKTAGGVQETTGILASPLVDALKDLQGDQTLSGPVFKDTKKNANIINAEFDKVFEKEFLQVSSPKGGTRFESMRVAKLRNLNESLLSAQGIEKKSDLSKALTFRANPEVAARYATSTALRKLMNNAVAKNLVAFAGYSNSPSVSQWMNDVGVKNLSNKTKQISITQEVLEEFDYIEDAVKKNILSQEVFQSYSPEGNVLGGIPKEPDPEVTKALNQQAIAQANLAADEATIARGQIADEVIEAQKTLAEKKKESKIKTAAETLEKTRQQGVELIDGLINKAKKIPLPKVDPDKLKSLAPLVTQNPYAIGALGVGSGIIGYQSNLEAAQKGDTILGKDPSPMQSQMYALTRTAAEEAGGLPATVAMEAQNIVQAAPKAVMAATDLVGSGLAAVAGEVKNLAEQPNVDRTQRQTLSEQLKNFMAGMGTNLNISN